MNVQPLPAVRQPRAPQGSATAAKAAAFDAEAAEEAELQREREAMEALIMAFIKQEDAIMKKWIEMI